VTYSIVARDPDTGEMGVAPADVVERIVPAHP
jgi:uncharacterized Ntn-hydrolase superfamily protein